MMSDDFSYNNKRHNFSYSFFFFVCLIYWVKKFLKKMIWLIITSIYKSINTCNLKKLWKILRKEFLYLLTKLFDQYENCKFAFLALKKFHPSGFTALKSPFPLVIPKKKKKVQCVLFFFPRNMYNVYLKIIITK